MTRRTYTLTDYRRDLARLDDLRRSEAPGLSSLLAERLIADAELSPPSAPPESGPRRRQTPAGGFVAQRSTIPAGPAALRAAGLTPRPCGRLRCSALAVALAVLALLLNGTGCQTFGSEPDEGGASPELVLWANDPVLREHAEAARTRLEGAAGVSFGIVETPDEADGIVPLVWFDRPDSGDGSDLQGREWHRAGDPVWLDVALETPAEILETVVLHEIMHALGAEHIGTGEGVLSPETWTGREWPITNADLEALCSARRCSRFSAEAP